MERPLLKFKVIIESDKHITELQTDDYASARKFYKDALSENTFNRAYKFRCTIFGKTPSTEWRQIETSTK